MPIGLLSLKMLKYLLATALNYIHMVSLYRDELLQWIAGRGGGWELVVGQLEANRQSQEQLQNVKLI